MLSALQAFVPIAAIFYSWQLARMFRVYVVVVRACAHPPTLTALLKGMSAGLLLQAAVALWQRFGLGLLQTPGTFLHQNTLGMVTHFVVFPFFALLLSGRVGWLPSVVLPAGIIVELLTTSRATVGLAGLGYSVVFVLSAMRGWTSRKAVALIVAVAVGAVIVPLALSAIASRGSDQLEGSERRARRPRIGCVDDALGLSFGSRSQQLRFRGKYCKVIIKERALGGLATSLLSIMSTGWSPLRADISD